MRPNTLLPLMESEISAGFPSPAEGLMDRSLDLNERLIHNAAATFLVRVRGQSMIGAGIFNGDIIIVDRSLEASEGAIIVARVDSEFTVKRLRRNGKSWFLAAENPDYPARDITGDVSFEVWGVVTYAIRDLCHS